MAKSISTKIISIVLVCLMCASCIVSTGFVSASAYTDWYLCGTFNNWQASESSKMTTTDGVIYTKTLVLNAGSYQFKIATSDWKNQINNNGGNITLNVSGDYDQDVKFTANVNARSYNVTFTEKNSLSSARLNTYIRCAWSDHRESVLVQEDNKLTIRDYNSNDIDSYNYMWNVTPADGGEGVYVQNVATEQYLAVSNNAFTFTNTPYKWTSKFSGGNIVFLDNGKSINIEDFQNGVSLSTVPSNYHSARWSFVYDYTMTSNKVLDAGYEAVATNGQTIVSTATGNEKVWKLTQDISKYPTFSAPNSPLAEAVYNLSAEEVVKNTYVDEEVGEVFITGTSWNKVWTRDTAYSNLLSLSWIDPDIAENCARKKVHTDKNTGFAVLEQDTGTGGSYPTSTDKIITLVSVWETYLTNGNVEELKYFYDVGYNTMMQDLHVAMDPTTGLFKGETGGIDWRDQTYPDWMSSKWSSGMVDIAEGKSAVVNATYVRAYEIMARMADILNKGDDAVEFWTTAAENLEKAMSEQLWSEDLGIYASWMYPEYMGNPLSGKGDIQGNGYALWFDVGTDEQIQSIMDNYPLVNYGAPTTYPQKMGNGEHAQRYYHNRGIWPGWQTIMMVGANLQGNEALAEEIFDSNIRTAATALSNYEVVNYETGEGIHSTQQLWSIAGTLAGYYRLTFGMNYDENGITFNPTVQDWMVGPLSLSNYKYRDAVLNITVNGTGDTVTNFTVNGKEENIDTYVLPANAKGNYTISITLAGNSDVDTFKQGDKYLEICPSMPTMSYNEATKTLYWTPVSGLTYKLWTGKEYIDVTGLTSYKVDDSVYGSYSLLSVTDGGIESEYSEPIIVSPDRIKVEAESGSISNSSYIKKSVSGYSGTGYVVDNLNKSAELEITVDIPKDGEYLLHGIYNNFGAGQDGLSCGIRSVYVDGVDYGTMVFPEVYSDYKWQESSHLTVYLTKGTHTIKVFYDKTNYYDQNMAWYTQFDIASDIDDYVYGIQFKNSVEFDYFLFDYVGDHTHRYTSEITKKATCTEDGLKTFTCWCKNSYTEVITAVGKHTEVTVAGKAPTCTETGLTEGKKCSACGKVLVAQTVIKATGHKHTSKVTKKATCTQEGVTTYTCACGNTYTKKIAKVAHKTTKSTKKATYFANGYKNRTTCKVCKKVISKGTTLKKLTLKTPKAKYTAGKKKLTVKYTKVSGATGFQVKYKIGKKSVTKTYNTKKSVSKTIKKLKKGTYKVYVRAFVKSGSKKAYSSWTKAKKVKVK